MKRGASLRAVSSRARPARAARARAPARADRRARHGLHPARGARRAPAGGARSRRRAAACVVAWCQGPLAPLTGDAERDPRVEIEIEDVAATIRRAAAPAASPRFDAILLDLYTDPGRRRRALLRGRHAGGDARRARARRRLRRLVGAARSGFERRLRAAGFEAARSRPGRGGLRHAVYTAQPCGTAERGAVSRRARGRFWALVLAFALAQLAVHARAGFTFPPPWIDEAQFLWQAKAIADTGTLLAPQLHPERAILWMPPGWFVLTGAALRVLRLRLRARAHALVRLPARGLRAARVVCCAACRTRRARCCSRAGSSSAAASSRPETSRAWRRCCCSACSRACAAAQRRCWLGLALLAATPLVHPNGVWFCAGGAVWVGLERARGRACRARAARSRAGLAVAAAWLAWAALAASDAAAFRHDLAYQLARKAASRRARGPRRRSAVGARGAARARPAPAARGSGRRAARLPRGPGARRAQLRPGVLVRDLRRALLPLAQRARARGGAAVARAAGRSARAIRVSRSAGVLARCCSCNVAGAPRFRIRSAIPANLVWHRMRFSDGEPYLTAEDRALRARLPRRRSPRPASGRGCVSSLRPRRSSTRTSTAARSDLGAPLPRAGARLVSAAHEPLEREEARARLFARAGVDPAASARLHARRTSAGTRSRVRTATPDPSERRALSEPLAFANPGACKRSARGRGERSN